MTEYPFEAPIDPRLNCRECSTAIHAVAIVVNTGLAFAGLNEYRWVHVADGAEECPPPEIKPVANPYDAWEATRRVEAVRAARRIAEDAYAEALEPCEWAR